MGMGIIVDTSGFLINFRSSFLILAVQILKASFGLMHTISLPLRMMFSHRVGCIVVAGLCQSKAVVPIPMFVSAQGGWFLGQLGPPVIGRSLGGGVCKLMRS